jgi:formate/nitrite transporter
MAERVEQFAVMKARLPLPTLSMLGILAGAFIGMGAMMYTLIESDATLGFAATRLLGGLAFSLGLILVVVAGAELFTGNNLLAMAWADGSVSTRDVLRNWCVACVTNFVGAAGLAVLVWLSGVCSPNDGALARTVVDIATAKTGLPLHQAFFRGLLCNVLVCVAVWMTFAGRSVIDKVAVVVFPIAAFVAMGFENSIANVYYFQLAALLGAPLGWSDFLRNLAPVLAGNIAGGSLLVALVYYFIYIRPARTRTAGK